MNLTYRVYWGTAVLDEIAEYRVCVHPDLGDHPEAFEPRGPWPGAPKPAGEPRLWVRILDRDRREVWLTADRLDISHPTQEAAA